MKDRYDIRPDAQAFDEIRITTVPRYKTSGLSGDEWRISAKIQFFRKGELVHEDFRHNTKIAAQHLAYIYDKAIDDGHAFFAGIEGKCDQEGCSNPAEVFYSKKRSGCSRCGEFKEAGFTRLDGTKEKVIRKFCKKHSTRGDCGLDDADKNYEVLKGDPIEPSEKDKSPSAFAGIIEVSHKDVQ